MKYLLCRSRTNGHGATSIAVEADTEAEVVEHAKLLITGDVWKVRILDTEGEQARHVGDVTSTGYKVSEAPW